MSARRASSTEWKAVKQSYERLKLKTAGSTLERPFAMVGLLDPVLPGIGQHAGPVRVYRPDGTLKEEMSATEWRRRHGNPFRKARERLRKDDQYAS